MALAGRLVPHAFQLRQHGVAFELFMHFGKFDAGGELHGSGIDLRPADHENLVRLARLRDGVLQRMRRHRAIRRPVRLAGDHDVGATGQRLFGQRVPGLAAHHNGIAHGQRLEALQVLGNAPGNAAILADDAILGGCDNQCDLAHDAISSSAAWSSRQVIHSGFRSAPMRL